MKKSIFLVGFLITSIIFMAILFLNSSVNSQREKAVLEKMNKVVGEYENIGAAGDDHFIAEYTDAKG